MRRQVEQYLLEHTSFDLPEGVAARHAQRVLQRRYVDLLYQGVPRERIDEQMATLQAAAAEKAQRDLKLQFILDRITRDRSIEVGPDEVNARVASMAAAYDRRPERMRQDLERDGSLDVLRVSLAEEKALDALLTDARITEGEAADETDAGQAS
jgi:trigger factor